MHTHTHTHTHTYGLVVDMMKQELKGGMGLGFPSPSPSSSSSSSFFSSSFLLPSVLAFLLTVGKTDGGMEGEGGRGREEEVGWGRLMFANTLVTTIWWWDSG